MTTNTSPTLQTLPVEILHYILDNVDVPTILRSFRNTCRQFSNVVNSYDRYTLNFQSISKPDFDCICHLINPACVTSLILSENEETFDQIKLFLSHFSLRQFTRLRSLSLFLTTESKFRTIVGRFSNHSLQSFSIKIDRWDDRRKTTTAALLSLIINKANLFKLELNIQDGRLEKIRWPKQCFIQSLKINHTVSFNQIHHIVQCSPYLRKLNIKSFHTPTPDQLILGPLSHLTSLILEKISSTIDELESILKMIPTLIHLKLIGSGNYYDGYRWEHFIQLHLSSLNKFEFFFNKTYNTQQTFIDAEHIIASFQTPFWLENKQWFVTCEIDNNTSCSLTLYSIPLCVPFLSYETMKISISTLPKLNEKNISLMDNVNTVRLDFTKLNLENKV